MKHPDEVEKLRSDLAKIKEKYVSEFLSYLTKIVYFKDQQKHQVEKCSICIEDYEDGQQMLKIPECNHIFHPDCCLEWFNSKNQEKEQRCPMCNIQLDIAEMRKRHDIQMF